MAMIGGSDDRTTHVRLNSSERQHLALLTGIPHELEPMFSSRAGNVTLNWSQHRALIAILADRLMLVEFDEDYEVTPEGQIISPGPAKCRGVAPGSGSVAAADPRELIQAVRRW